MLSYRSFAFLTLHKAGSAFATVIVRNLMVENGWESYDFATEAFDAGLNEFNFIRAKLAFPIKGKSFFGPMRAESISLLSEIPALIPIVHIRDPRDCLVSYYFSICYSHVLPGAGPERERFKNLRAFYRQNTIDDFCLEVLTNGDRSFKLLRKVVESDNRAVLSRYEDMVANFSKWLRLLSVELSIEISDDRISELNAEIKNPEIEDIYSHKRQVTPGDFRRKLKPETQEKLTDFFHSDLTFFGYSTET